jgi:pimeloyl-ACP methyl ester carboxylesterase
MILEKSIVIATSDNAEIHGVLHQPQNQGHPIIVLVHGLTGHMEEYIHLRLARLLSRHGYPVIRFNQYGDQERARKFYTSTITQHVSDTRDVVNYARQEGFEKIILAGHSLGSPVAIAAAGSSIEALILIDPTGWPKDRIRVWKTQDPLLNISYLDWSKRILLGERWIEDAKTSPDPYLQFARLQCPVQIIAAANADQLAFCTRYSDAHPQHPEIQIVPNATHCFTEDGAVETLAGLMIEWIGKKSE